MIKIIVHLPETPEKQRELAIKAAAAHADGVSRKLQEHPCPKEQKLKLYNELKKACHG